MQVYKCLYRFSFKSLQDRCLLIYVPGTVLFVCSCVCVCVHEGAASSVEEKGVGGGGLRWCWPRLSLEKGLAEEKLATTENGK